MKITVIGLRGIPNVQGGIETHAENLYPLLVELGCDVEIIVRNSAVPESLPRTWKGVHITRIWAPATKGIESFVHTLLAVIYAAFHRPDILHIHAVGPAIMTPLARLLGLKVVVTHHGPDYDREKWGPMAKKVLLIGEKFGMKFSNQRIVISKVISELVHQKYGVDSYIIPNGAKISTLPETQEALKKFDLTAGRYVIQVSRIVPEKRQLDLIEAFNKANMHNYKLVLVGKITPQEEYSQKIISSAENSNNIILADFQTGVTLHELLSNAGLFVLPSSHEGLPIALLEALSFGLPVIASNIPANLEIDLAPEHYFPLGDIDQLALKLQRMGTEPIDSNKREQIRQWVAERYNWPAIAEQTLAVYQRMMVK